ncbi:hypothetical protein V6N13_026993 [Hibiscus sabdariffa]|uniref:Uncharacterized protein n=1 Tax=Hibiscus sabdariffa TaxID=183260 RepID=A0ABR2N9X5_9ROSI
MMGRSDPLTTLYDFAFLHKTDSQLCFLPLFALHVTVYSLIADANKSLFLSAAITQFYSERGEEWRTWGNGKNSKWKLGLKRSIEFEYHYHTISKSLRYVLKAFVFGGYWPTAILLAYTAASALP